MLKVSRRLNYGLQLMIALSGEPLTASIPTSAIADKLEIPLPFLHQIAHTLMQAGLIKATPGPRGGLHIGTNPEEITLLDIFEALEGKLTLPTCDVDSKNADTPENIVAMETWQKIGDEICASFSSITMASLLEKKEQIKID